MPRLTVPCRATRQLTTTSVYRRCSGCSRRIEPPPPEIGFVLARDVEGGGGPDEALEVFQNVITMEPDDAFTHLGLGHTYAVKGMYAEAINEYETTISLYGEVTNGLIDLGYAYAMSGKRDEALAILNKLKMSKEYVSPAIMASSTPD